HADSRRAHSFPTRRSSDLDGHVRPQVKVLKYKTQFTAHAIDLLAIGSDQFAIFGFLELEFFAGDQDLALVRVFQQVDAAQQGGLDRKSTRLNSSHVKTSYA